MPYQVSRWKGNQKISGSRITWTHIPTLIYNFESNRVELGFSVLILKSGTSGKDYLGR